MIQENRTQIIINYLMVEKGGVVGISKYIDYEYEVLLIK